MAKQLDNFNLEDDDELTRKLAEKQAQRMEAFGRELEALMQKYGVVLEPVFELSNQGAIGQIRIAPAPAQRRQ